MNVSNPVLYPSMMYLIQYSTPVYTVSDLMIYLPSILYLIQVLNARDRILSVTLPGGIATIATRGQCSITVSLVTATHLDQSASRVIAPVIGCHWRSTLYVQVG